MIIIRGPKLNYIIMVFSGNYYLELHNGMTYFLWIFFFFLPKRWKLVVWTLYNINININIYFVKTYIDSKKSYTA